MQQPSWLHEAASKLSSDKKQLLAASLLDENVRPDIIDPMERYRHIVANILTEQGMMCVLNGEGADTLASDIRTFRTPRGIQITAATDTGVHRENNEDRIVINPFAEFAAVCDGMGGHGDGDLAADILAYQLLRHPDDVEKAAKEAQGEFVIGNLQKDCGTCFASAQIIFEDDGSMFLDAKQAGDVRIIIVNADGTLACESRDETFTQAALDAGRITKDQAVYDGMRHVVANAIYKGEGRITHSFHKLPLTSRQKILILSDGISDNITTEEILEFIQGKSGLEIITIFSEITQVRMQHWREIKNNTLNRKDDGMFSDGFASEPKPDNRGIAVIEIPSLVA